MQALTAQQLLALWESGHVRKPAQRALALLAAACPESPVESLAALSIGRRDAGLLRLREWAFGSQLAGTSDCPKCGELLEMSFAADEIRASDETESEVFFLRAAEYELKFRLPNSLDLIAIEKLEGEDREALKEVLIDRCVLEARCNDEQIQIVQLPEQTIAALSQRMAEVDPQSDVRLALNCPNCSHSWSALFDIVSFFWREIDAWARRVLQEIHVLASAYGWPEQYILMMNPGRRAFYLEMLMA